MGFLQNIPHFSLVILFHGHAGVEIHLKSFPDKLSQPPCHLNPAGLSHTVCWKSHSGLNIAPESTGSEAPAATHARMFSADEDLSKPHPGECPVWEAPASSPSPGRNGKEAERLAAKWKSTFYRDHLTLLFYFTDEDPEAQRGKVICSRSHSRTFYPQVPVLSLLCTW